MRLRSSICHLRTQLPNAARLCYPWRELQKRASAFLVLPHRDDMEPSHSCRAAFPRSMRGGSHTVRSRSGVAYLRAWAGQAACDTSMRWSARGPDWELRRSDGRERRSDFFRENVGKLDDDAG